jgi:peptidoglycan/xylan/chitin deacetylase (PgdA/CDA1 family)
MNEVRNDPDNQFDSTSFTTQLADNTNKMEVVQKGVKKTKIPIVTFLSDDGTIEDYTKLKPIFQEKGVPCTIAIISSFIGNGGYMNLSQIQELNALGWEISSHTVSHVSLSTLATDAEIINEVVNSKNTLTSLGFNIKNLVYPYGGHNLTVRNIVKQYYRSAVQVGGGLNAGALKTFSLRRVALGSYFDTGTNTNTLDYYKSKVDEAIANNSWVIFMMHPHSVDHDATQQQYLSDLIDYIKSKNVSILNLDNALDSVGNIMDVGDNHDGTLEYVSISSEGKFYAKSSPTPDYYTKINTTGITTSTPLTSFAMNTVSVGTFSTVSGSGLPELGAGTLETYYFDNSSYGFQLFYPFNVNKTYKRTWNYNTNVWNAWIDLFADAKTVPISGINAYTSSNLITDFPLSKISVFYVNNAGASGFPNTTAGIVTTYRLGGNGWDRQEYRKYNTNELWVRYVDLSGAWTDWIPLSPQGGVTTNRPKTAVIGLNYFDTTLSKPVWCKTLGAKELDTLTISAGATTTGNITITLNGIAVNVTVNAGDTAGAIGDKIRSTSFSGWTVGGTSGSATVTFTKFTPGTNSAPTFSDSGTTGTTASFVVTTIGTNNVWVDATGVTV